MSDEALAIGIDVGGTGIAIGLIDSSGSILAREEFPTRCPGGFDESIARIIKVCRRLVAGRAGARGIGVGCPGPLDLAAGVVLNPFTMDWQGRNLVQPIHEAMGMTVILENDADAALIGEVACGAGNGVDKIVMLTFGTGVGGAVMIDGVVVRGAADEHPEIGHLFAVGDGPKCYCGIDGCLEIVASGEALKRRAAELHLQGAGEVFAAAERGEPGAVEVISQIQQACRMTAATLIRVYCPRRIVLGGGIMEHQYEMYAAPMREVIAGMTMLPPCGVEVAKAMLGNDAGMIGAAMRVLQQRS
jgi:glucokinase